MKNRLIQHGVKCTVISCGQPAQLARSTYNRNLIGKHPDYSCIPSNAKRVLAAITTAYSGVQGTLESDINCTMSKKIDSVIKNGMADVSSRCNILTAEASNFVGQEHKDADIALKILAKLFMKQ